MASAQTPAGVPAVGSDYNDKSPDGSYRFGYQTGDTGAHYHTAVASKDNTVIGRFGSRDPSKGQVVETQYTSGKRGFRPRGPNVARKYDLNQNKIPYNPPVNPNSPNYNPTLDGYHDPNEDPSYSFQFRTPTYTKNEAADSRGHVNGLYSFVDDAGERHDVGYEAGAKIGFNVKTPFPDSKVFSGTFYRGPPSKPGSKTVRGKTSIQQRNDGSYRFVSAGPDQRRTEVSDASGHRRGSYSYIDDKGQQRTVEYIAGPNIGYRIINKGLGVKFPTAAPFIPPRFPDFPNGFDPSFPTELPPFPLDGDSSSGAGGTTPGSGNKGPGINAGGTGTGGGSSGNKGGDDDNFSDIFGSSGSPGSEDDKSGSGGSGSDSFGGFGGSGNQGGFGSGNQGGFGNDGSNVGNPGGFGGGSGNQGGFGNGNQDGFGSGNQGGFGNQGNDKQGGYGNNQGGFGNNQGGFGNNQGGFGNNQGEHGSTTESGFGSSSPGFGGGSGGFGNSQGGFGGGQSGFGQGGGGNDLGSGFGSTSERPGSSSPGFSDGFSPLGFPGSTTNRPSNSNRNPPRPSSGFPSPSTPDPFNGYPDGRPPFGSPTLLNTRPGYFPPGCCGPTTTSRPFGSGSTTLASAFPEDDPSRPPRPLRPSLEDDFLQNSFTDLPKKYFNHPSYFKPKPRPGQRNEPEKDDSTFLSSDKRFYSFPPGIAVRAHVQSVDILPFGSRIPPPGFALEHSLTHRSGG